MINFDALFSILCVFAILTIIYGPWQSLCTDYSRQHLFELRSKLFNLAAEGRLSFDAKVYKEARLQIESTIRFAHDLTLPKFFIMSLFIKRNKRENPVRSLFHQIDSISDKKTSDEVREILKSVSRTMLLMMFAKSPFAVALSLVIFAISYLLGASKLIESKTQKVENIILMEANTASAKL